MGGSAISTNSAADNRTDRVEDVESPLPVFFEHETVGDVLFAHARVTVCQVPRNATSSLDLLAVGPTFTRPACRAAAAAIGRYLLPAPDLNSTPAGHRCCCCPSTGQTDRQTDGRILDRFMTLAAYDTIRYDTRCYFNVRSKADISQLNLPHGNDN